MAANDPRTLRLVREAKRGDDRSFSKLLDMVEPDLKKIAAHYYIEGQSREDVLQELRIGVFKAVQSYDETKDMAFKNFCVNLVCKRHLATAISTAKRMKNSVLNKAASLDAPFVLGDDGNMQTLADFIPDRPNPLEETLGMPLIEDIIIREEFEVHATVLRKKLTPLESDIFDQYSFDSSYKDIAETLGVQSKCVDNALMRIRNKAREVYAHGDENDTEEAPEEQEADQPARRRKTSRRGDQE